MFLSVYGEFYVVVILVLNDDASVRRIADLFGHCDVAVPGVVCANVVQSFKIGSRRYLCVSRYHASVTAESVLRVEGSIS